MANLSTNYAYDFMLIYGYDLVDRGTKNPALDPILLDRLDHGLGLLSNADAPKNIIVAGKYGGRDRVFYERTGLTESHFMKKYLIKKGIKPEHIYEETEGISTLDSTKRAYDFFVVTKNWRSGILVSTLEHLPRVILQVLNIFPSDFGLLFSGPTIEDPKRRAEFLALEKRGIERFFSEELNASLVRNLDIL